MALTLAVLGCVSLFSMKAFADQSSAGSGDQSDHNASGGGGTDHDGNAGWANGGWSSNNEGIRIYMVDLKGKVISNVYDFYYDDCTNVPKVPDDNKGYMWNDTLVNNNTALNGGGVTGIHPMSDCEVLNGFPHITKKSGDGRASNSPEVLKWCTSMDEDGIYQINHVICNIFWDRDGTTYKGQSIYDAYMNNEVRCVIEGLYWFVPAYKENGKVTAVNFLNDNPNAKYFVYGNIQFIADQNVKNSGKINLWGGKNTGGYVSYAGKLWPHALELEQDEPDMGWGIPAQRSGAVEQENIHNQNSQGLTSGYGLHIWKEKDTAQVWATYKAKKVYWQGGKQVSEIVGGAQPPCPAPTMGSAKDMDPKRPVKIVKIYEHYHTDAQGNTKINPVAVRFNDGDSCCRTIQVQDEPGFKVEHWFASAYKPDTTRYWKSAGANWDALRIKGTHSDIVEVPDQWGADFEYLTVHLVKRTKEQPKELKELVLNESEVTHSYQTKDIDGWGEGQIAMTYGSMAGTCTVEKALHEYDEEEIPCDISCTSDGIIGHWKEGHGPGSGAHGTRQVPCVHKVPCGKAYSLSASTADKNYFYSFKNGAAIDNSIMTEAELFKGIEDYSQVKQDGSVTSVDGGQNVMDHLNYKFTIWRGDDIPTLAAYKNNSTDLEALLGAPQNTDAIHTRIPTQGMYEKAVTIKFIDNPADSQADYKTKAACEDHPECFTEVVHTFDDAASTTFNSSAKVYHYSGEAKNPAVAGAKLTDIRTKHFGEGASGSASQNGVTTASHYTMLKDYDDTLKFTPYIRMTYMKSEDINKKLPVDILSQHKSEMGISAGMTIGWKRNGDDNGYNVALRSDQWATDNRATSGDKGWNKSNQVLDGGNIFQLSTTPHENEDEKYGASIYVTGYYPVISGGSGREKGSNMPGTFQYPAEWNENNGVADMQAVSDMVVKMLDDTYMAMYADGNVSNRQTHYNAFSGDIVYPGSAFDGRKTSSDEKYYLRNDVDKNAVNYSGVTAEIEGSSTNKYEFSADIAGNIYMNNQIILKKDQGIEDLTNPTAREIDSYTKVVTNLANSITRDRGTDETATWVKDGHWYNEAVEGIWVYVRDTEIKVGLPDNDGLGGVQAILDPRLCPTSQGTVDKYQNATVVQFKSMCDGDYTASVLGNNTAYLPDFDNLLMTRPIFTCISIQDSD